jgi:NDP-hexose-3-ketoreductase
MRVLILGWSDIAVRRVVPACRALGIEQVDIASCSRPVQLPGGCRGTLFTDYDAAITGSDADLVWVSTLNQRHAELASAALDAGHHVVIDKPATLALADTRDLIERAARRGRLIAEATVYAFHPRIAAIRQMFLDAATEPKQISVQFGYPPLAASNFRWRAAAGGGALWDLGPYAVSAGRLFFGTAPKRINAVSERVAGDEVETSFSLLAAYPGTRTLVGHFSMRCEYTNRLEITAPRASLRLEPVFTSAPDHPARLHTSIGGRRGETLVPPLMPLPVSLPRSAPRSAMAITALSPRPCWPTPRRWTHCEQPAVVKHHDPPDGLQPPTRPLPRPSWRSSIGLLAQFEAVVLAPEASVGPRPG